MLGGLFDEWDVRVVPSLKEFVDCARFTQLGFLSILAGVPCLLEHLEVKPFIKMEEELTMSSSTGGAAYIDIISPLSVLRDVHCETRS